MNTNRAARPVWLDADAGTFDDFVAEVSRTTDLADWPFAAAVDGNVPIYEGAVVREAAAGVRRRALTAEWGTILATGPGIIVIRDAVDGDAVARATELFTDIIESERASGVGGGDHFAKPGANNRVWNALQKHCFADPDNFADYYASEAIALASEAWLGPGYQVTAQVNRVNPGGAAQNPHRDYHLGFMAPDELTAYPARVHGLSPLLTLQGAVAHGDMPVESGPTMLLPYSQRFFEGYLAFSRPPFQEYFTDHHVQLPLQSGDAAFFNPAVMHGAGSNASARPRMANLLQVSSALGRATEAVDRTAIATRVYPVLLAALGDGRLSRRAADNVIAASAEGYAFPTNLDTDPPIGGLAPQSEAALVREALDEGLDAESLAARLAERAACRQP